MTSPSSGALEAVERILNRGEAGEVLRQVVDVLHERTGEWFAIAFGSETRASSPGDRPTNHQRHPIVSHGQPVALLVSPYCDPKK
jgi:hypothetical protein